ncbi:Hpt domain-containing protein [Luteimonas sp BLCC-B24]|uniref:response regulator n=1 Tax=Luteimonas sp. BLCC-B24 TaxID=3025317 RepID=UPI00234C29CD|nr:response regulator [Luteimonas sp. BLCC-B24]MDC7807699.1 Hpt domain-containing protein [Luteimonas sp. BLCC-B24]
MNGLRDAIDHTMLGWIKPELDEVLRQARIELEGFVETTDDPSRMRLCAGYLHQAQGTLRMVELYAPAMVVEEMERLADALRDNATADRDAASAALLRGMLLLPDYLERLQGGHRDIPIVLLPLLNELRAARGEAGLSESILFAPDLARPVPVTAAPQTQAGGSRDAALRALRAALQAWPAGGTAGDAGALVTALQALTPLFDEESVRRMVWVAARIAEALADGAFDAGSQQALRQVFSGVERELRQQAQDAPLASLSADSAQEPTRQLLYHAVHTDSEHPALRDLRDTFDLQAQLPSDSELEHARSSLSGRNRALLDTVSAAVKEDLLRVKDALDLHLRTGSTDVGALKSQVEVLAGVADTLGMLGLGAARSVVQQQRDVMRSIVDGSTPASEDTLLDVAGALLYVDATLDDQVSRLGSDAPDVGDDTLAVEAQQSVVVLVREAIANFSDARQALVAFVETNWDHAELQEVPRLLAEVGGALQMLEIPQARAYLDGVRLYAERELIARKRVPNGRQLDTFADALASLEYYLEALREPRAGRADILDIARSSLEALGYWPLPEAHASGAAEWSDDVEGDALALDLQAIDVAQLARGSETRAPAEPPPAAEPRPVPASTPVAAPLRPADGGFEIVGDEIDDEIREVFLEEFAGEIENLDTLLPPWRAHPDNLDLLRPIRRVFHTLKGSGRLVGARRLGEFSWAIESMLNRVLDGTRPASPAVVAMVDQAFYALPELQAVLRGEADLRADLDTMQASAARIAAGDDAMPDHPAPVQAASARPGVDAAASETAAPAAASGEMPQAPTTDTAVTAPAPAVDASVPPSPVDDASVPASVDALLLEILDAEVRGHLDAVAGCLDAVRSGGPFDGERLLRALHTMHGAFAMAEVPAIGLVLGPAEDYAQRLAAAKAVPDAEGVEVLEAVAAEIRDALTALHGDAPRIPVRHALAARVADVRDRLPEAAIERFAFQFDDEDTGGDASADAERAEAERLEAERLEQERLAAERAEVERLEAERLEQERLAAERAEAERLEAERLEQKRLAAERAEAERLEAERLEQERLAAERAEAERLEAERLEQERLAAERAEAERLEAERLEQERLAAERADAERLEAERLEQERLAAERAEAERLEQERLAAERAEAERLEAERLEQERLAAERAEAERLEAERQEQERLAAERAEAERQASAAGDETVPAATFDTAPDAELDALRAQDAIDAQVLEAARARFDDEARQQQDDDGAADVAVAPDDDVEVATGPAPVAEDAPLENASDVHVEAEAASTGFAADIEANAEAAATETEADAAEAANAQDGLDAAVEPATGVDDALQSRDAVPAIADAAPATDADTPEPEPDSEAWPPPVDEALDPDAPLDLEGLDPELIDIFVEEGIDLLDHADGLLAQLREDPESRDAVAGLQRDLHTLKGGARMAGLMEIGDLGHAMETLLESVSERRTTLRRADQALLERGFDRLHTMVTRAGERRAIGASQALVDAFSGTAPVVSDGQARPAVEAAKVELAPLSAPLLPEDMGADDEEGALRGSQEQVRIRADLLDRLVTYAGEVAIYRARLEQQLGAFRGAMNELAQTNTRLRDQLRRLDIETEAQIIARYQREGDTANTAFDPLELDRFSTLQQLSRALGETAADLGSLQQTLDDQTRQYETLLLQQSRVSSDLQEGLMRTRMVPFDAMVPRLRRVVRQAAQDTGKQVQLRLDGAQGELDRNVLERMVSPLEHLLRNAIAHGLESPSGRRAAGKSDEGSVRIAVRREGSEVVLEVSDDGAGLDRAAIRRRAEERGLLHADAVISDADLDAMILQPGFSTATEVSRLAGRGVGMDVVASEVRQLGGSFDIRSRKGQGTTFTLRLPQTLAVTQAAFVRIGETSFAVPIASVRGVGRIAREDARPGAVYPYGGEDYQLHDLGRLVGHAQARAEGHLQMPLLLIRAGELRAAVAVDEVLGNREIVVKPVGPQVSSVPGIFGATIMGDGRVVVILDVAPLVRRHLAHLAEVGDGAVEEPAPVVEQRPVPLVMVVDDSVTMRKVTGRVLERHNFEVMTARDGVDALERMEERVPDLMLLDIEMPRMDGYELATQMKADPRLRDVTIMMITSRTGEKHRQRAFEIGVERYLGKPYQEHDLLRHVHELLKLERDDD